MNRRERRIITLRRNDSLAVLGRSSLELKPVIYLYNGASRSAVHNIDFHSIARNSNRSRSLRNLRSSAFSSAPGYGFPEGAHIDQNTPQPSRMSRFGLIKEFGEADSPATHTINCGMRAQLTVPPNPEDEPEKSSRFIIKVYISAATLDLVEFFILLFLLLKSCIVQGLTLNLISGSGTGPGEVMANFDELQLNEWRPVAEQRWKLGAPHQCKSKPSRQLRLFAY
ncbi:hypothetical protein TcasGA2_TC012442 [Tribolium castaneum]|uniref:Uncharacterized protein n=1 Tax=Tribolium castaneum TaxID=7070 RepID=D6X2B7_TRICA|nr:hypothetical protein TcasGA2_TC012442 [Tribolium castaneum]